MYDELVKRLRCQRFGNCPNCPMWYTEEVEPNLWRERCAAIDAADAIEELIAWHNADVRELGRQKILIAGMRPVVLCRDCKHNNACLTQAFVEEESKAPFDRNTFFCADGERGSYA